MPAANLFTTEPIQEHLKYKIQKPFVDIFTALSTNPKDFWDLVKLAWWGYKTIREMQKTPRPEISNTNKHNVHVMIRARDDFLSHDNSCRSKMYDGLLSFIAHKYDWDDHMSRRLDYWIRFIKASDWIDTGKLPETDWKLTEEDKKEPTYIRQQALKEALNNRDFPKVLNLIE